MFVLIFNTCITSEKKRIDRHNAIECERISKGESNDRSFLFLSRVMNESNSMYYTSIRIDSHSVG